MFRADAHAYNRINRAFYLRIILFSYKKKKYSFAMERSVRITWSIKGYHYFQVRPHIDIIMKVEPEHNNPRDPFALKVVMPALNDIPAEYHDNSTRDATSSRPRQTVRQIAGESLS